VFEVDVFERALHRSNLSDGSTLFNKVCYDVWNLRFEWENEAIVDEFTFVSFDNFSKSFLWLSFALETKTVIFEITNIPFEDAFALTDDSDAVTHLLHLGKEGRVKENRHPPFFPKAKDEVAEPLDPFRIETIGGLIKKKYFRLRKEGLC